MQQRDNIPFLLFNGTQTQQISGAESIWSLMENLARGLIDSRISRGILKNKTWRWIKSLGISFCWNTIHFYFAALLWKTKQTQRICPKCLQSFQLTDKCVQIISHWRQ